jgi:hypothetical protein
MYGVAHLVDDLQQASAAHDRVAGHQPGVRLRTTKCATPYDHDRGEVGPGPLGGAGRRLEGDAPRLLHDVLRPVRVADQRVRQAAHPGGVFEEGLDGDGGGVLHGCRGGRVAAAAGDSPILKKSTEPASGPVDPDGVDPGTPFHAGAVAGALPPRKSPELGVTGAAPGRAALGAVAGSTQPTNHLRALTWTRDNPSGHRSAGTTTVYTTRQALACPITDR